MARKEKKIAEAQEVKPVAEKPAKAKREATVLHSGMVGVAVNFLVIALLAAGLFYFLTNENQRQHESVSDLYRRHHLAVLDTYLRTNELVIATMTDAELLQILSLPGGDGVLTARYPGASYARIVTAALDPAVPNGISYAHQDMVLRVAAGQSVSPEISFYENHQVVTFARAVRAPEGAIAGVLLLSMPFSPLAISLSNFAPEAGRLELIQRNGSERAVILKVGESLAVDEMRVVATRNPGWEFGFAPVTSLGRNETMVSVATGLLVLAAVLSGLLLFWLLMSLQRQIKEDAEALAVFSENLLRYGNRQRPMMHFGVFSTLMSRLDHYWTEVKASRPTTKNDVSADQLGEISFREESPDLLGTAPAPKVVKPIAKKELDVGQEVRAEIFRAYDIRGVVGDGLDEAVVRAIGRAIGSEALARGEQLVMVGRDGRLSSPAMAAALIEGLRASGRDVIDVGMVPTPVLYFAAKTVGTGSGVMITGSHNPGNYNGFKIMLAGDTLAGDEIQALRKRIEKSDFTAGAGTLAQQNVVADYIDRVSGDIVLARPLRVVIDAGNGVAGAMAPRLFESLGCIVTPLFCEVDGNFPNHHPDPSKPENLADLIAAVAANGADIGIAFDGDGDRIGVVTGTGQNIFPDRLMMLLSKHVLMTNPGADIIFDVKCTRDLGVLISRLGGRPVMSKTGHSFIKAKLKETGAALAGEMSGHIFFNDRWFGFDDALYSAGRVLEILSLEAGDADAVFGEFPENPVTPEINIAVPDARKFSLVDEFVAAANFPDANIIVIDGLRVEFPEGWGLIRASNTTPCLVARFEGKTSSDLSAVQAKFRALMLRVAPELELPF